MAPTCPHQLVLVTDLYGKTTQPLNNLRRRKHGLSELVTRWLTSTLSSLSHSHLQLTLLSWLLTLQPQHKHGSLTWHSPTLLMLSKSTETSALKCTVLKLFSGADHKTTQLTSSATRLRLVLLPPSPSLNTQMVTVSSGVFKWTPELFFHQVSLLWSSSVLNGSLRTPLHLPTALSLISFAIGLKSKTITATGPSSTMTLTYLVEHGVALTLTLKSTLSGICSTPLWKWNSTTISGTQTSLGNKFTLTTNLVSWALVAWVADFFKTQTSTSRHWSMETTSLSKLVTKSSSTTTILLFNPLDFHRLTTPASSTILLIAHSTPKLSPVSHRSTPLMRSPPSNHLLNLNLVYKTGRAQSQLTLLSHQWIMQPTLVWLLQSPLLRHLIRPTLSSGMSKWTQTNLSSLTLTFNSSSHHYGLLRIPLLTSPLEPSQLSKTEVLHQHTLTLSVKCILLATICPMRQTVQILQWFQFLNGTTIIQVLLLILTCLHRVLMIFGTTPMMKNSMESGKKVLTKLHVTLQTLLNSNQLAAWVPESSTILIKPLFHWTTLPANSLSELVSRSSTGHLIKSSQSCNQLNLHRPSMSPWWTLVSSLQTVLPTLVFQHSSSPTFHNLLLLILSQHSDGSTNSTSVLVITSSQLLRTTSLTQWATTPESVLLPQLNLSRCWMDGLLLTLFPLTLRMQLLPVNPLKCGSLLNGTWVTTPLHQLRTSIYTAISATIPKMTILLALTMRLIHTLLLMISTHPLST